jgi:hypothetical protein
MMLRTDLHTLTFKPYFFVPPVFKIQKDVR